MLRLNQNESSSLSFRSRLVLGDDLDELVKKPENSVIAQEIDSFRKALENDEKTLTVRLTKDTLTHSMCERDYLIQKLAKHNSLHMPETIAPFVGSVSDPKLAVSLIESILQRGDDLNIIAAARAMGDIKDPKLAASLIEKYTNGVVHSESPDNIDVGKDIKRAAAISSGNISDPEIRDALIVKLVAHTDVNVRKGAVLAVPKIDNPELRDSLIEKLMNDPNKLVRESAITLVADFSDPKKAAEGMEIVIANPDRVAITVS